jgi:hypothetical protein
VTRREKGPKQRCAKETPSVIQGHNGKKELFFTKLTFKCFSSIIFIEHLPVTTSSAEVGLFRRPENVSEIFTAASIKLAAFLFELTMPLVKLRSRVVESMGEVKKYKGEDMVVISNFKPRIGGNTQ